MKKIGKINIGLLIIIILFGIYSVPKIIDRLSNENVIDTNRLHQKEELSFLKIDGKDRKVPDFVLTNQDSLFISNDDLLGKVYVLEFFFSRCPDICIEMNKNMKKIG
jgi:protein SCO1/2